MTTQKLDFDFEEKDGLITLTKETTGGDHVNIFLIKKIKQLCQEIDSRNYKDEKYQEAIGNAFQEIYARLNNLEQQEAHNHILLTVIDSQLNKMLDKLDKIERKV
jgi:hypothetical protein